MSEREKLELLAAIDPQAFFIIGEQKLREALEQKERKTLEQKHKALERERKLDQRGSDNVYRFLHEFHRQFPTIPLLAFDRRRIKQTLRVYPASCWHKAYEWVKRIGGPHGFLMDYTLGLGLILPETTFDMVSGTRMAKPKPKPVRISGERSVSDYDRSLLNPRCLPLAKTPIKRGKRIRSFRRLTEREREQVSNVLWDWRKPKRENLPLVMYVPPDERKQVIRTGAYSYDRLECYLGVHLNANGFTGVPVSRNWFELERERKCLERERLERLERERLERLERVSVPLPVWVMLGRTRTGVPVYGKR
jgi:hypothetical protein